MGGNDRFCSPECEQALVKQRKKQQRTMYIFMGVLVLLFVVMLAFPNACSSLLGGGTTARP
ncbi:MAG: DUF2116 family Zn-ribbon domain-containing protein [Chloroflexi bacterium]|nr:DUF2116 family Zn-ribbon domain-containing protein [Chloroflexota bacterium]